MCTTAQLDFSRIVLEPGVNIKIFSGCAHKKDIYKFHTTGPPKSVIPFPSISVLLPYLLPLWLAILIDVPNIAYAMTECQRWMALLLSP